MTAWSKNCEFLTAWPANAAAEHCLRATDAFAARLFHAPAMVKTDVLPKAERGAFSGWTARGKQKKQKAAHPKGAPFARPGR